MMDEGRGNNYTIEFIKSKIKRQIYRQNDRRTQCLECREIRCIDGTRVEASAAESAGLAVRLFFSFSSFLFLFLLSFFSLPTTLLDSPRQAHVCSIYDGLHDVLESRILNSSHVVSRGRGSILHRIKIGLYLNCAVRCVPHSIRR